MAVNNAAVMAEALWPGVKLKLLDHFVSELGKGLPIAREQVERSVRKETAALGQSDEVIERLLELAFTLLVTEQAAGAMVNHDRLEPWLADCRAKEAFKPFYWPRLERYMRESGNLPPLVRSRMDSDTDEILNKCGDPRPGGSTFARRGMVMGDVQAGKTGNYSALVCKAADAGYEVIIVLAGITNSLRSQTQERLDETFIGIKSEFEGQLRQKLSLLQYAERKDRIPVYGTTRTRDFNQAAARSYGITLAGIHEPLIFVTKKNKSALEALLSWLKEQTDGGCINAPLLLIDDEADNASVNTQKNPDRTTTINGVIREILKLFNRSSYVGYTATPFANIFIDPESNNAMIGDDLFPKHFIKVLERPSNYVGGHRIFSDTADLKQPMLQPLEDYGDILPLTHKRDHSLSELPGSLEKAVRTFVLIRGVRLLDGEGHKHCSMMINVSRFNDVQNKVAALVWEYFNDLKNSVTAWGGQGTASTDPNMLALRETFAEVLSGSTDYSADAVLRNLKGAMATINWKMVNMQGGPLEYSSNEKQGLHVIAIGGLALSRGLTLEGLCVSYVLRNAGASDTLMQMGRWFGYRQGYEALCRLWLPDVTIVHYANVQDGIDELRDELVRMKEVGATPEQFGLKVRQSPSGILITAKNKMYSATDRTFSPDFSGSHIERHTLHNDQMRNLRNRETITAFFDDLGTPAGVDHDRRMPNLGWRNVAGGLVRDLINKLEIPDTSTGLHSSGKTTPLGDYIGDRLADELSTWDVALPFATQRDFQGITLGAHEVGVRNRHRGTLENGMYRVTGSANRVADKTDAKYFWNHMSASKAPNKKQEKWFCSERSHPLLIIHVLDVKLAGDSADFELKTPVLTYSVCLPGTRVKGKERSYFINKILQEQLELDMAEEYIDDEDEAVYD